MYSPEGSPGIVCLSPQASGASHLPSPLLGGEVSVVQERKGNVPFQLSM